MAKLTVRALITLKPGKWASDGGARGGGTLVSRRLTSGVVLFYFRYTGPDGQREALPLGQWDAHGENLSLEHAREIAAGLSTRYRNGDRDLRAVLRAEQQERDRQRVMVADKAAAQGSRTLGALLTAYADQMARDGKPSARSVRTALFHHVRDAWPTLWATPLTEIDADTLLAIVAKPTNRGTLRQAEKLRAYLRAAFAAGMRARHNAKSSPALRDLRVTSNPARDLTPIEGANRARDRALSVAELRAYWSRIRDVPAHAALRFHLLTGCQRIEQLARATFADYDDDTQSLKLLDGKGRRTSARKHHVPLIPAAIDAMRAMHSGELGPFLFTLTGGLSSAGYSGIREHVRAVADAMHTAGELTGGAFTPGDLRRTVETRLADLGVSRDTRARLQSHGLGGVQERHYDRHDYLPETRAALETLNRLLTDSQAAIIPIKRGLKTGSP